MQSIPFHALDRVALQLALLNVMVATYLICKGMAFVGTVFGRRDPPRKLIRSKVARSNES